MSAPITHIRLDALRDAPLQIDPFPFVVVPNFLRFERAAEINETFPPIEARGSFPLSQLSWGAAFGALVADLQHADLRAAIEEKFGVTLTDRHEMITVRGFANPRDGRIHADTPSKYLTMLLYLNDGWAHAGGRLRLLRRPDNLNDYVTEIAPTFGTCLIFKVTENCWHGHEPFDGARRVLQLNYITDKGALNRHLLRHNLTARLKRLRQLLPSGAR
jgi:SM-20-related protein